MKCYLATFVALLLLSNCPLGADASSYTFYRLPTSIQPDRYHLKIITHLEDPANLTFNGEVSIHFRVLEDTNNITLHAKSLHIDESRIQLVSSGDPDHQLCLEGIETVLEEDYYIVRLCQNILKGEMYQVKLHFSRILSEESEGYNCRTYVDETTNEKRWLSVTHFEPTYARTTFPCFDEPNYKAKFTIWLGHNNSMTALSNMPLEKQIPLNDLKDYVWSIFEESVPMSTYLVAFTVNDFAYKESKAEGSDVVFRTWSRRDYINECDYAAEVAPAILQYYEELFGIPFPLKKIDDVAIPDYDVFAMENWGLITYRGSTLFVTNDSIRREKEELLVSTVAHELAHQWFGNLVTMKWWTDLWLNEGFATYIATLGTHNFRPEWGKYNEDSLLNFIIILSADASSSSHPISKPLLSTSHIMGHFDAIAYQKGSAVLRMVHLILGQDVFFEGVRHYLQKHKFQNAEQDDLWAAFTESAYKSNSIKHRQNMKTILDSWTLQSGYPLVNVSRNYETGSIEISQYRCFENCTMSDEESNGCWWVPLSYTTKSEFDFMTTIPKEWLECDESGKSIALKLDNVTRANEWIIFNIQVSGIYRVMYDSNNYRLLRETLCSDKFVDIHVMNRFQIIDDVLTFSWNGLLDYGITFDILEYLNKEQEYGPWLSALDGLNKVFDLLNRFPQYQPYLKAYMRYIIEPIYHQVGGLNYTDDTRQQVKSQITSFACLAELQDCVQTAITHFQEWKLSKNPDEENKIPANIRDTVYCTAIRHGDADDWNFLWQRFEVTESFAEMFAIITALCCSNDETLLRDFINSTFSEDSNMSEFHVALTIETMATSTAGAQIARKYYADHIAALEYDIDFIISTCVKIVSIEDFNRMSALIDSNKEHFKEDEERIQSTFDEVSFNLQWIERNLENVKTHLQTRLSRMGIIEENVV